MVKDGREQQQQANDNVIHVISTVKACYGSGKNEKARKNSNQHTFVANNSKNGWQIVWEVGEIAG